MFFNLAFFVILLPSCVLAYAICPKRYRWLVLLAFSWVCIFYDGRWLVVFPLLTAASAYLCGLWLHRLFSQRAEALKERGVKKREVKAVYRKRLRVVVTVGVIFNLGLLFACKYLKTCVVAAFPTVDYRQLRATTPLGFFGMAPGISFYTLMAISYMVDVYREKTMPERNPAKLALWLAFFPQILEGPISRYSDTSEDLMAGHDITADALFIGVLRMLWGFVKKVIVADRLNEFVGNVFDNYSLIEGYILVIGVVLYVVQLYFDFSGTIDVALGAGQIFGVKLPENFRQPFFSRTASEFWQRWHITLGAFFKDYVYYPVSLSAPAKKLTTAARRRFGLRYGPLMAGSLALLCVWVCNGIWHGAGTQYLCFGLYYFVIITLGGIAEPMAQDLAARFGVNRDGVLYQLFQRLRTLTVVVFGELIFRANGLSAAIEMVKRMLWCRDSSELYWGHFSRLGLGPYNAGIVVLVVIVMFCISMLKEHGVDITAKLSKRGIVMRWAVIIVLFLAVVMFGAYGFGYDPVDPMYAQF